MVKIEKLLNTEIHTTVLTEAHCYVRAGASWMLCSSVDLPACCGEDASSEQRVVHQQPPHANLYICEALKKSKASNRPSFTQRSILRVQAIGAKDIRVASTTPPSIRLLVGNGVSLLAGHHLAQVAQHRRCKRTPRAPL